MKAVELTSGGLPHVPEPGLRVERSALTVRQKSAAGVVVQASRDEGPNRKERPAAKEPASAGLYGEGSRFAQNAGGAISPKWRTA